MRRFGLYLSGELLFAACLTLVVMAVVIATVIVCFVARFL